MSRKKFLAWDLFFWMNWFDIKTGGNCKRDEDEFSIEFLRKIN